VYVLINPVIDQVTHLVVKRLTHWLTVVAGLALLFAMLKPAPLVNAQKISSGNNSLGQFQVFTLAGGVTVAGVGLRGVGSGEIDLTGVPTGASIYRAYLYWATLGFANTYTRPTLEAQPVAGQLIGTTGDTCWDVQNNFVYRADVTNLVSGNASYSLAGLPGNLAGGNDSQGASLVVIYRHSASPLTTIVINDGAVALDLTHASYTDTIRGFTASSPVGDAQVNYLVGDGQAEWDSGNITFNGTPLANGVFSGLDGPYWDSRAFDVTSLTSGSSATTTVSNSAPENPGQPDCLLWAATIFSVTAAAPQTSNQMSAFFHQTLLGDVTSAGVGLRGQGQGMINLSGIPANGRVQHAFLYWATLGSSSQFTSPQLNGNTVSGQRIGTSGDTCWGVPANYVFRADVTGLVSGNGDYTISGLPSNLADGNDSQGASLVVIYSAPGLYRTVIINDGAVTLDLVTSTYTDTLGPFTADQPDAQVQITYLVGDGQPQWNSGSISFEGSTIAGGVFSGADGEYWDTLRFDVSGLISEPDATTTITNDFPGNPYSPDCLLWAASVLAVETEPPVFDHFSFPLILR
jgi:hypothetical protein